MKWVLLILQIHLVQSQTYYESKETKLTAITTDQNGNSSKPFPTKSTTECIIECQRNSKKSFYVENTDQCFCLDKDGGQEIFSNDSLVGIMLQKEENMEAKPMQMTTVQKKQTSKLFS